MKKKIVDNIFEIIKKGTHKGIGQLYTDDSTYTLNTISLNNQSTVNFGSYSYLGLEHDIRLKKAAINAIENYGIQFPSSRTYVSSTLYKELEQLLDAIFDAPTVLSKTTTLAHVATMPIVVEDGDVIIMDQQVHSSVQFMIKHMEGYNIPFQIVRHNNIEQLESKIIELSKAFKRVWYMCDGVYSMYGDTAPINELERLLNTHKKFNLYVDDAHGMSWTGKNGRGFVLSKIELHDKMILITSLNKAFAAGGALTVCKDKKLSDRIKTCGSPLIFAGQHQNSALGAAVECVKIHLSPDIYTLQKELKEKITYCYELILKTDLPIISDGETPIFFIGVGLPRVGYNLVNKMISSGFFVNLAIFPAVAETCTGIRFTINKNITFEQIDTMVSTLEYNFKLVLNEEARTLKDIHKAFRKIKTFSTPSDNYTTKNEAFVLEHEKSILAFKQKEWDNLFKDQSTFDWNGLALLEHVFEEQEKKWTFDYFIIRNQNGTPVFATYTTTSTVKDDILSSAVISRQIEKVRESDEFYMCSKTIMLGCPLSFGKHYFIDKKNDCKEIVHLFLQKIEELRDEYNANTINLRDFEVEKSGELVEYIVNSGYIKAKILDNFSIDLKSNYSFEQYLQTLKSTQRRYIKRRALDKEFLFNVKTIKNANAKTINTLYDLYQNVKQKSFELNLFSYPKILFHEAIKAEKWDVFSLELRVENLKTVAVSYSYVNRKTYNFLIVGLDYNYSESHDIYSQVLLQITKRAIDLNCKKINLGYTTAQNKRKFGAINIQSNALLQINDKHNVIVLENMSENQSLNIIDQNNKLKRFETTAKVIQ